MCLENLFTNIFPNIHSTDTSGKDTLREHSPHKGSSLNKQYVYSYKDVYHIVGPRILAFYSAISER